MTMNRHALLWGNLMEDCNGIKCSVIRIQWDNHLLYHNLLWPNLLLVNIVVLRLHSIK